MMNKIWAMRNSQKNKKGFTLIELIVVVAILGILAALVVPQVTGYVQKAQTNTDNANAQMLYTAGQLYLTDLEVNSGTIPKTFSEADLFTAGYIPEKPDGEADYTVIEATTTAKMGLTMVYTPTGRTPITLPPAPPAPSN